MTSELSSLIPVLSTVAILTSTALFADETVPPGGDATAITPAAQEVIDKALLAMGGASAFSQVTSVDFDCSLASSQGTLLMTVAAKPNSGVRVEQSLSPPDSTEVVRHQVLTTNFAAGWARDLVDGGVQVMPPGVSSSVARAGELWSMLHSGLGQFKLVEHDGSAVFAGRPCARLRFSSPRSQGLQQVLLFFDDETGLPLGQETSTSAGMIISGTSRIEEWQTTNGMLIPKRIAVQGQNGESMLTFTRIEFNTVPSSAFEMPSDVQVLVGAANDS